jgi:hypothetical protein
VSANAAAGAPGCWASRLVRIAASTAAPIDAPIVWTVVIALVAFGIWAGPRPWYAAAATGMATAATPMPQTSSAAASTTSWVRPPTWV